jgi:hypothetical protein
MSDVNLDVFDVDRIQEKIKSLMYIDVDRNIDVFDDI